MMSQKEMQQGVNITQAKVSSIHLYKHGATLEIQLRTETWS